MYLRPAQLENIDFIVAQEARPDFRNFIGRWTRDQHISNLQDPNQQYLVIESNGEAAVLAERGAIGYAILTGLRSPHSTIELARFVIAQPGQGYGRKALRQILKLAFEEYGAHRFWLDVFPHNSRARHLYESLGFQVEGTLRDAEKRDEAYYSLIIMSMLEDEYRQLYPDENPAPSRLADRSR